MKNMTITALLLLSSAILVSCGSLAPSSSKTEDTRSSQDIKQEIEEELQVMNNIPRFNITTGQFENEFEQSEFYKKKMKKTPFGYITENNTIEVITKSKDTNSDEKLPVIYIYLANNENKSDFSTIETNFYEVCTIIFDSLGEPLKKEKLLPIIQKTGNEEKEITYSENLLINFAITDQEIQIIITPASD